MLGKLVNCPADFVRVISDVMANPGQTLDQIEESIQKINLQIMAVQQMSSAQE